MAKIREKETKLKEPKGGGISFTRFSSPYLTPSSPLISLAHPEPRNPEP